MVSRNLLSALTSLTLGVQVHAAPNLIFILADDLGYGELGSFGQTVIQTPHLDKMASEGMSFTHFYAGSTVCAPSRSVLMTGKHQGRTRIRGNSPNSQTAESALRPEDRTIAESLKDAGYATGMIGKWGLGSTGEASSGLPGNKGFDTFFGFLDHVHAHNHYPDYLWRNEEKILLPNQVTKIGNRGGGYAQEGILYADDLCADEALKFVSRNQQQPFFLYWSFILPHANNERNGALKDGAEVPDYGPYTNEDWPNPDKGQAAMITRLDSYVGRMLDHLDKLGIAENTLVIFTSDNGPHNESSHDLQRFDPSGPFTGIKRSLTDGGIRVPMIARWPGKISPATRSAHVAYFGDWFATACDFAEIATPEDLDSISFAPTLLGDTPQKEHQFLYWEFHERGFHQAVLLDGRWKAIRKGSIENPLSLYDLENDIAESKDVSGENPEVISKIIRYLETARSEAAAWPVK